jgi:TatD DNase family protein
MILTDTHCHIHENDYPLPVEDVIMRSHENDVKSLVCVGTTYTSSLEAVRLAELYPDVWATLGIHPHEAAGATQAGLKEMTKLADHDKVVAIGEIGLDYYYTHSPKSRQIELLHAQIELALSHSLPISFHVRDAFDDFWPIFNRYEGTIRGVLHSFTDSQANLDKALERGLYIGVNGISTFTKDPVQQAMFGAIPLERMLLETDAPFLTPTPKRGTINEPAFVRYVAEFHAHERGIDLEEVAKVTTANARQLFSKTKH